MNLHIFKLVLACLVLVTCCSAVTLVPQAFNMGGLDDIGGEIDNLAEQAAQQRFHNAVDSANRYFGNGAGRLVAARPWPRPPGQLLDNFHAYLGNPRSNYYTLGQHDGKELFGVPWPVRWNGAAQHSNHVFIFGVDSRAGDVVPMGFANFQSRGVASDPNAFVEEAQRLRRTATYYDIRDRLPIQ